MSALRSDEARKSFGVGNGANAGLIPGVEVTWTASSQNARSVDAVVLQRSTKRIRISAHLAMGCFKKVWVKPESLEIRS